MTNDNEVIATLKSIKNSGEYNKYPELLNALDIVAEDEASTIYNPNWPPLQQMEVKSILGLLLSELVGAIAGGIRGDGLMLSFGELLHPYFTLQ